MEEKKLLSAAHVADAFMKQYYVILNKCPENLHKFYQELSLLGWPGVDGVVTPVTTLSGINEKVMSSDYKYCSVEVKTTDAQESLEGGIIVIVTGCLTKKDNVKKNISQTFFLARQEKGFFVLNDILRFFDVCEPKIEAAGSTDDDNDQSVPTQNSAPCDTCDGPTPLNFKAAIQNGKVEEASKLSVSVKNSANGAAASTPSVPSGEKSVSPAKDAKPQPVDTPNANEKAPSFVKPATNVKVPSVVTPALHVASKITYASVVAKDIPAVSPKVAAVTSNTSKQAVAPSASRPSSSPRGDISPKVLTPSGGVTKAPTSSSKVAPRSPTGGQGMPSSSTHAEGKCSVSIKIEASDLYPDLSDDDDAAKGIYIGGLPYDITKQGIVDVVRQFGPVRRYTDMVQIRRHEDGFCCGFVEFESADSARRAVQAHHVMFGDKEAYIMHKRQPHNRGNNGSARSPTRRGQHNGNSSGNGNGNGAKNDDWIYYTPRSRQASRDRLK